MYTKNRVLFDNKYASQKKVTSSGINSTLVHQFFDGKKDTFFFAENK